MKKTRILIAVIVVLIALAIVVLINHRDRQIFVSITEMKACVVDSDCVPVGCNCWCSGGDGFSYEEIVNQQYIDEWYLQQGCEPTYACLEEECPPVRAVCRDHVCVVEKIDYSKINEDEDIRIELQAGSYYLGENIKIKLTVIGDGLYFHGPCDMWFEIKVGNEWQMIGNCPEPPYDDEPFPNATGSELELTIPTSSQSDYYYSYELVAGTYRYAITYVTRQGRQTIYTPEFEIHE